MPGKDMLARGTPLVKFRLSLDSPLNCRRSIAKLTRAYAAGEIEAMPYKALVWGIGQTLPFFRLGLEEELLRRVEALERIAEEAQV